MKNILLMISKDDSKNFLEAELDETYTQEYFS